MRAVSTASDGANTVERTGRGESGRADDAGIRSRADRAEKPGPGEADSASRPRPSFSERGGTRCTTKGPLRRTNGGLCCAPTERRDAGDLNRSRGPRGLRECRGAERCRARGRPREVTSAERHPERRPRSNPRICPPRKKPRIRGRRERSEGRIEAVLDERRRERSERRLSIGQSRGASGRISRLPHHAPRPRRASPSDFTDVREVSRIFGSLGPRNGRRSRDRVGLLQLEALNIRWVIPRARSGTRSGSRIRLATNPTRPILAGRTPHRCRSVVMEKRQPPIRVVVRSVLPLRGDGCDPRVDLLPVRGPRDR